MPVDPVLPRNLDDLYGPGAEDAATADEWERNYDTTDMNVYRVYMWLLDYLADVSDDGGDGMQDAPDDVKAKHRKRIEDVEKVLELLYSHALEYAEAHNLRVDLL